MDICNDEAPENVDFVDFVILVSILSQEGVVKLHGDEDHYLWAGMESFWRRCVV